MREWNLGNGLGNVCDTIRGKLHYASHTIECNERGRTIINLDTYEVTALIWALSEYMDNHNLKGEEK